MSGPHTRTLCQTISILKQSGHSSIDNLGQVNRPFTGLVRTSLLTPAGQSYTDRTAERQVTSSTLKMRRHSLESWRIFTHRRVCLAETMLLNFRMSVKKIRISLKPDSNNEYYVTV